VHFSLGSNSGESVGGWLTKLKTKQFSVRFLLIVVTIVAIAIWHLEFGKFSNAKYAVDRSKCIGNLENVARAIYAELSQTSMLPCDDTGHLSLRMLSRRRNVVIVCTCGREYLVNRKVDKHTFDKTDHPIPIVFDPPLAHIVSRRPTQISANILYSDGRVRVWMGSNDEYIDLLNSMLVLQTEVSSK
jgi:hypothetical protein